MPLDRLSPYGARDDAPLSRLQIADGRFPLEQIEERAEGGTPLALEVRVPLQDETGVISCGSQKVGMHRQVRQAELGKAALPGAQNFAPAAKL